MICVLRGFAALEARCAYCVFVASRRGHGGIFSHEGVPSHEEKLDADFAGKISPNLIPVNQGIVVWSQSFARMRKSRKFTMPSPGSGAIASTGLTC